MKAVVIYSSAHGKTYAFAKSIAMHLWSLGYSVSLLSIQDYKPEKLTDADALFLGCWTSGWFVFYQHPNKRWKAFAKKLPDHLPPKVALFSTYLTRTGLLFKRMQRAIPALNGRKLLTLKSKNTVLTENQKARIEQYLNINKHHKK